MNITATGSAAETVCQALLALTGKIITWGRKPWLLLRLQSVLKSV